MAKNPLSSIIYMGTRFTLNPATLLLISSPSRSILCSRRRRKPRKHKHHQSPFDPPHKNSNTFFPKPYPTPLLITKPPTPRSCSRLDALDAVVSDLESSVARGVRPFDAQIFASLLETCYQLQAIDQGIRIHRLIPTRLLRANAGVSSKLLRLYAASGLVERAHQVFDEMPKREESAFPWNSLISGYAELGMYEDAVALYHQMEEDGVEPDRFTFPRVLKACAGIGSVGFGEKVHRRLVRHGLGEDIYALNALVDMYAKCGDIVRAREVFDQIPQRDLISWNSMLTSYIRHGLFAEALGAFRGILRDGFDPDPVSISAILSGGATVKLGAELHGWILRRGCEWDLSIANSLISLYAGWGKLRQARWLFDEMPGRDIVSWNSIISAHSKDRRALTYFAWMESIGDVPDSVTFISLLSACAHLGAIKDGEKFYFIMRSRYGIRVSMEHYACLVNLYGRAGLVDEAYDVIMKRMGFDAGPTVWGALLYACYLHGVVSIGEVAAERLFELEPDNGHNFDVLMMIYGKEGRSEDVERVRKMKRDRGLEL